MPSWVSPLPIWTKVVSSQQTLYEGFLSTGDALIFFKECKKKKKLYKILTANIWPDFVHTARFIGRFFFFGVKLCSVRNVSWKISQKILHLKHIFHHFSFVCLLFQVKFRPTVEREKITPQKPKNGLCSCWFHFILTVTFFKIGRKPNTSQQLLYHSLCNKTSAFLWAALNVATLNANWSILLSSSIFFESLYNEYRRGKSGQNCSGTAGEQ